MWVDQEKDASGDAGPSSDDSSLQAEDRDAWDETIATTRSISALDDLCQDLLRRWRQGDHVPVEHYLGLHPTLLAHETDAFELIYTEYLVRKELDLSNPLEEILARFPGLADQLHRQLELHRAFNAMDGGWSRNYDTILPDQSESQFRWPAPAGYQIERVLGRGGMAVVYEARQLRLNRVVALKMIRSGGNATPEEAIRFQAEAEVIASFQHPNIVQVHAIGDFEGQPYFEMEYVAGGSLATQLLGTPRQPREAAGLMEVIARAIHEAHRRGIVHRDLKPSNVLMMPDGTPKIADFGVAKMLNSDSGLTQTESVLGSPAYMPPELADGRARHAGPSADIYSLGAMFYELLTGRPPFRAPTILETLDLVRHTEPVPPSQLQPGMPRDAETIVLRCLSKEPERRYGSAEDLAEDLGRFLRNEPILARPTGPIERGVRWARRNRLVAGLMTAVMIVLVGGFTGMAVLWVEAVRERNRASLLSAGLAFDNGLVMAQSGRYERAVHLFAEAVRLGETDPKLVRVARANIAALVPEVPRLVGAVLRTSGPINCGAISPDGRLYAVGGFDGSVTIWDLDTMRRIGPPGYHEQDTKVVRNVAFSPNGQMVVSSGDDGSLRTWSTTDGQPVGPPLRPPGLTTGAVHMAHQPGGEIVVSRCEEFVYFWHIATGKLIAKSDKCNESGISLDFSANGKTLVTVHYGSVYRWDGTTGRPIGSPIRLPIDAQTAGVSPDGKRLAVAYGNRDLIGNLGNGKPVLLIYDVATGVATQPIPDIDRDHVATAHVVKYSPDGKRIVVGDDNGTVQLFDAEGNPIGNFPKCEGIIRDAAFRPRRPDCPGYLGLGDDLAARRPRRPPPGIGHRGSRPDAPGRLPARRTDDRPGR